MASEFQSSFIPKTPVTQEVFVKKKAGFLGIIAVSLFICSIILSGAMFAYKGIISGDITSLQSQLADAEKSIDKEAIKDLSVFSKKLDLVKSLVWKHQVISGFLTSLSSSTVSNISFTEFNYSNLVPTNTKIIMKGRAPDYKSVALQEEIFSENKYWDNVEFSEMALTGEGEVNFTVAVSINPEILVYDPPISSISNTVPENDSLVEDLDAEIESLNDIDLDNL